MSGLFVIGFWPIPQIRIARMGKEGAMLIDVQERHT